MVWCNVIYLDTDKYVMFNKLRAINKDIKVIQYIEKVGGHNKKDT